MTDFKILKMIGYMFFVFCHNVKKWYPRILQSPEKEQRQLLAVTWGTKGSQIQEQIPSVIPFNVKFETR